MTITRCETYGCHARAKLAVSYECRTPEGTYKPFRHAYCAPDALLAQKGYREIEQEALASGTVVVRNLTVVSLADLPPLPNSTRSPIVPRPSV